MKHKLFRNIPLLLLSVLMAVSVISGSAKKKDMLDGSDSRKADYIFMEAMRQHALEREDAYYELLRRAYELDSTNTDVGFYLGYYGIMISQDDSLQFNRNFDLMRKHFNANPTQYYTNYIYGSINDRIGNTDESLKVWEALDSAYPHKLEIAFKLAEALAASQDSASVQKAIDVYNRIETLQGKNIPVVSRKISAYFTSRDTAAIFNEIRMLLASSPRSVENNVFAGDVYAMFSEPDSALVYYNKAVDIDPSSGLAYYARANYYKSTGDSTAYDTEVFRALQQEDLDLDTKLELLTSYVRELYSNPAQQTRIQQLFDNLLEQYPHEVDVHDLYCSYLIAIQDFEGAAEQMRYSLDSDPANAERWRTLIGLYFQTKDYQKAAEAGEAALHYYPDNSLLHQLLGADYSQLGEYDKALAQLDKAYEYADSNDLESLSDIMSSIGDVYYAKGDPDSAFIKYEEALRLNPDNLLALNNCAYHLALEGRDLDKAEEMSARTIEAQPDNATSLDTYAWIMFKKKNYVEAEVYIRRALDNTTEPSQELFHHAGDIFFMNAMPDEALDYWEQALDLDPDDELLQKKVKHKTYFYQ